MDKGPWYRQSNLTAKSHPRISPHRLIDRPDLGTIPQAQHVEQPRTAVGVDRRTAARTAYGDIGSAGIDGVGAERLRVRHDPIARRALAGVDGADPAGTDMAVGEARQVEHLALAVILLDQDARFWWIDRDRHRGCAVEVARTVVSAGGQGAVPFEQLVLHLGECLVALGMIATMAAQSNQMVSGNPGTVQFSGPCKGYPNDRRWGAKQPPQFQKLAIATMWRKCNFATS